VVQRRHQVRFTEAALADDHDWTPLVRANSLDAFQEIVRGIGDFQKCLRRDLGRAGMGSVGQLDSRSTEAFTPKFFAQSQCQHYVCFPFFN